jgi:hypothetical protein
VVGTEAAMAAEARAEVKVVESMSDAVVVVALCCCKPQE